jgi:hypothetical protein
MDEYGKEDFFSDALTATLKKSMIKKTKSAKQKTSKQ